MADMSPMAEEDSPSSVIHKRELAEDTDGDALSPQKRPLNNNNNDVATVFLIDASDVNDEHDPHDESAVEVDEVISIIPVSSCLALLRPAAPLVLGLNIGVPGLSLWPAFRCRNPSPLRNDSVIVKCVV